jgi:hypothetical protein
MTEKRNSYRWESQKERDHYEDLDVGGRIILRIKIDLTRYRMGWYELDRSDSE